MQQVDVITRQIVLIVILGLIGYIAGRTNYLPKESGTILSRVVIKLTAPLLIITTMANYNFTKKTLTDGVWIFLYGAFFLLLSVLIGKFLAKRLKLSDATANIFRMHTVFGNIVYLAYPLLISLYGEKGIIYSIFFSIANDVFLWTIGVYLVNRHKSTRWQDNLKHMINGNTISFSLGLIFIIINLQGILADHPAAKVVYQVLYDSLNPLGKTTIYLSMVFIGLILSDIHIGSIREFLSRKPLFVLAAFKLLIIPFAAMLILFALGDFVDPFVKTIIVLQLAMPCATIVPAMASQYGSDYKFATEAVFVTTILGMLTIPLMVYINGLLN